MLKNTTQQFGLITKFFHWLLFIMLTIAVIAGNIVSDIPKGAEKFEAIGMHKSIGAVILLLISLRFLWRLINVMPSLPQETTKKQASMAHMMHWVLYILMFSQPISGVMMSQASGYPVSLLGQFELPMILEKNQQLAELFHTAHGFIWIALVIAVFGHVAAALHHHFIVKDDVLRKMTFLPSHN